MKLEFLPIEPSIEADETKKREETPMTTSPLFGDLVGRCDAPHSVCWLLPQVRRC